MNLNIDDLNQEEPWQTTSLQVSTRGRCLLEFVLSLV